MWRKLILAFAAASVAAADGAAKPAFLQACEDDGDAGCAAKLAAAAAGDDVATVDAALNGLQRFEEAKPLLRKLMPVARRVLGESHDLTLRMRATYARALYDDPNATLDNLREAVSTLEDTERTARRVLGGAHPVTTWIGENLQAARPALRAHEPS